MGEAVPFAGVGVAVALREFVPPPAPPPGVPDGESEVVMDVEKVVLGGEEGEGKLDTVASSRGERVARGVLVAHVEMVDRRDGVKSVDRVKEADREGLAGVPVLTPAREGVPLPLIEGEEEALPPTPFPPPKPVELVGEWVGELDREGVMEVSGE